MKKCGFCRVDLGAAGTFKSGSSGEEICTKCHKNEKKYGKPGVCKYCQLTAAFLDGKCVHCSYSERKYGSPVECSVCRLRAAFPKDPSFREKKLFCRLCKVSYKRGVARAENNQKRVHNDVKEGGGGNEKEVEGKQPRIAQESSEFFKKLKTGSTLDMNNDSTADQILVITQLKDQVATLQKQLNQKDQTLFERDKKIATLNAENLRMDKEYRSKILQIHKEHEESMNGLREQIRVLSRLNASLSKAKKGLQNDSTSNSPSIV